LPSKGELNKLYLNRAAIGGFGSRYYWSSTEMPGGAYAYVQDFLNGNQPIGLESNTFGVRAVRSF